MRNTLEYPVTVEEVIGYFENEKERINLQIDQHMICGDMRPLYFDEALKLLYKQRVANTSRAADGASEDKSLQDS